MFLSEKEFEKMNRILSTKDNKPKKKKQSEIFEVKPKKKKQSEIFETKEKKKVGRTVARKRKIKEVNKKNKKSLYY